ncbi:MAG: histidine kinase dimerization/phosphoacceptor domain -containing protein, partial [Pseudomonadales bacterium]
NGLFIFGGNNGFNVFDPVKIRTKNTYVPPIVLTQFSKLNQVFLHSRALAETERLRLDPDESVIGFSFAAIDFTQPKKNQFRYRLKGFDPDWTEATGQHQATYTNLDPGQYLFEVIGSNNDLVWNDSGASIAIEVLPPLWATWWAYIGYLLLLLLGVFLLLQNNTRRQRFEAEKRYSERLQLYIESLEQATDCVVIANAQREILFANHAIETLHGMTPTEALGRDLITVLARNSSEQDHIARILDQLGRFEGEVAGPPSSPDQTTEVTIALVQGAKLSEAAVVSISRDITQRKQTEAELADHQKNLESLVADRSIALQREISEHKEARSDLAASLVEKELLLKEVHHRVKNNMQVISSLLNMQADAQEDLVLSNLLGESQQRIKSMSLIHESLYQSDDLLEINFEDYIRTLATGLCRFYTIPGVEVQLDIVVDEVALGLDTAVPCGLIINELISNSLKHGFNDHNGRAAVIDVHFVKDQGKFRLRISDNGAGLPEDFDLGRSGSMGMEIVDILTQQLEGRLSYQSNAGAQFLIEFPAGERHVHA